MNATVRRERGVKEGHPFMHYYYYRPKAAGLHLGQSVNISHEKKHEHNG